jgi:hypothetical protein
MKKQLIGTTKNGKTVYVDTEDSHAATHIADTPDLLHVVQRVLPLLEPEEDSICLASDMGEVVGLSDLVETSEDDEILYAKRLNRDNYTRFALNRKAEPSNFVTVVLQRDIEGNYELWSAWIGPVTPQFPSDKLASPDSISFWRKHALVWGNQAIQPGTEKDEWPWD